MFGRPLPGWVKRAWENYRIFSLPHILATLVASVVVTTSPLFWACQVGANLLCGAVFFGVSYLHRVR